MRFTSTRDFMAFIETLGEVGYRPPSPYFMIEKRVDALPDYISRYGVTMVYREIPRTRRDFNGVEHREIVRREVHVLLTRNKATAMDLSLISDA